MQESSQPQSNSPQSNSPQSGLPNQPPPAEYMQRTQFFLPLAKPRVTYVLIGINLLAFVVTIAYQVYLVNLQIGLNGLMDFFQVVTSSAASPAQIVLYVLGEKENLAIAHGEYWRLFTAMFLHGGIIHLFFNMYALLSLGSLAEAYLGHLRYSAVYFLAGLFGSFASYAMSLHPSVGASGAIAGVIGALLVYFLYYRENFGVRGRSMLQQIVFVIVINAFFGLSSTGIDNWGHLGGLVGGAAVAWGILPRYERPQIALPGVYPLQIQQRQAIEIGWTALWIVLFVAGTYWATQINLNVYFQ